MPWVLKPHQTTNLSLSRCTDRFLFHYFWIFGRKTVSSYSWSLAFSLISPLLSFFSVSDVLTPLSDCKQESVEKMDQRILGVSCMCGMGLHNGILCCGFLCARIISLYFSTLFLPLSCVYSVSLLRIPRQELLRPIYIARAITASPLHGYHACVFTSRLPRHSSEFHFWVITPELSRSTTHVNRVITPALVSSS